MVDVPFPEPENYRRWCGPGGEHLLTPVSFRPWRRCFRKTIEIRCWHCEFRAAYEGVKP